jgi:hypothetical protein
VPIAAAGHGPAVSLEDLISLTHGVPETMVMRSAHQKTGAAVLFMLSRVFVIKKPTAVSIPEVEISPGVVLVVIG